MSIFSRPWQKLAWKKSTSCLFGDGEGHFIAALALGEVQQGLYSGGQYLPGEGRAGVFDVGVQQAGVLGYHDLGLRVRIVVGAAVADIDEAGVRG